MSQNGCSHQTNIDRDTECQENIFVILANNIFVCMITRVKLIQILTTTLSVEYITSLNDLKVLK